MKFKPIIFGLILNLFACTHAFAVQVYRIDPTPVMTTSGNVPIGGYPALYAVPNATINLCTDPACSIPAPAYTDASGNTLCPINAPVTLAGTSLCVSATGPQGQFGFWIVPGTYYFKISTPNGQSFGPYPISSPTPAPVFTIPFLVSTDYDFAAQAPGGTLSSGMSATITLRPCPRGVNGSDTAHYYYLSGGTGAAETVLSTGGTCSSGATSGTIIFTPANNHGGGWTIASATAGIQEAVDTSATEASVYIPAGNHSLYAGVTVSCARNVEIWGAGPSATKLLQFDPHATTIKMCSTFGIMSVHDLLFRPQAAGRDGIELEMDGPGGFGYIGRVHVLGGFQGIRLLDLNTVQAESVTMNSVDSIGLQATGSAGSVGGSMTDLQINAGGTTGYPLVIEAVNTGFVTSFDVSNSTFQGGASNILLQQVGAQSVGFESTFSNIIVDSATTSSIRAISTRPGYGFGLTFNGIYGGSIGTNAPVFDIEGVYGVHINGGTIAAQNGTTADAIVLYGCVHCQVRGVTLVSTGYGVFVTNNGGTPSSDINIQDNTIGRTLAASIENKYGIGTSTDANSQIIVTGNTVYSVTTDIDWHATGAGNVISYNTLKGTGTPTTAASLSNAAVFANTGISGEVDAFQGILINGATAVSLTITDNASSSIPSTTGLTPIIHLVSKDTIAETILIDSFGTNNTISMRRADGTLGSPTAVQAGQSLGNIIGAGYAATTGYVPARAAITFDATENWTSTNQGAGVGFFGTAIGATSPVARGAIKTGMELYTSGGAEPTGGDTGPGTLNMANGIYANGVQVLYSNGTTNTGLRTQAVTVMNLPAPVEGLCEWVVDSMSTTFGDVIMGSGMGHVLACYNGMAWTVH